MNTPLAKTSHQTAKAVHITSVVASGGTTPKLLFAGGSEWMVACVSTSSLSYKVQGSLDGSTNWHDLTGTYTPTAGGIERGSCVGFPFVRVLGTAGSGVVDFAMSLEGSGAGASGSGSNYTGISANTYASTVAGNAATKIPTTDSASRSSLSIHNADATLALWISVVTNGASAPTISSTQRDFVLSPEETLVADWTDAFDVYAQNSSGASTTSNVQVKEYVA